MSRLVKGSSQAMAWARKMKKARIRAAGRRTEHRFFGPGGVFEDEARAKRRTNPQAEVQELYLWATNDGGLYRQYEVPAIAYAEHAYKTKRWDFDQLTTQRRFLNWAKEAAKRYMKEFAGTGDPVDLVFSNSDIAQVALDRLNYWKREFGLGNFLNKNPDRPHGKFRSCVKKVPAKPLPVGSDPKKICGAALNPGWEGRPYGVRHQLNYWLVWRKSDGAGLVVSDMEKMRYLKPGYSVDGPFSNKKEAIYFFKHPQRNPITLNGNPPKRVCTNVAGVMYNRVWEIQAEKTGDKHKGFWYHPYKAKSDVQMLALDNGDVLIHSKAGKKLWRPD